MFVRKVLRHAFALAAALTVFSFSPAAAQLAPVNPVRQSVDPNGVDLFAGTVAANAPAVTIGNEQGLSYYQLNRGADWADNLVATLTISGSVVTISQGGSADSFTVSGSTYTPTEGNGATLSFDGTSIYTYKRADGTVMHFGKNYGPSNPTYNSVARLSDILAPNGTKLTAAYGTITYCKSAKTNDPTFCILHANVSHIQSLTSSYGYRINFNYAELPEYDPDDVNNQPDFDIYSTVIGVTAQNLAAPSSAMPSEGLSRTSSGGLFYFNVTDPMSRVTAYRMNGGAIAGIKLPGSTSEDVVYTYTSGRVTAVTTVVGTFSYSASDASGVRTVTVTNPASKVTTYKFDIASMRMTSLTDATSRTTSWQYDTSGRVTRVTQPEGNYTQYTYDARGNVTEKRAVAKSGSGLADIVASASFDSTCTNPVTCNQPNSTTDPKGNVTNYSYDPTHGGVLTVTAPAPTTGATRPKVTYSYTSLQAYYDTGSGIVASGAPVYRQTGSSTCQTAASCVGTADEVKTTISYGPQVAGTGNNLLPVSSTISAGDNSLAATTTRTYDAVGNVIGADGPQSGTADTVTSRYDADRELIGTISPDPDGVGPRKRLASRITYNSRGTAIETETGTVNGTTDTDWAAFVSLQQATTTLDGAGRKAQVTVTAGGTTYGVTQYSYNVVGLPECVAIRMNSATWSSLPSSACTLGTAGSAGPDRISKLIYDDAGRATQSIAALGVTGTETTTTTTYSANGQAGTITDPVGNVTAFAYDGFDRVYRTCFQTATQALCASTPTDYEQLTLDANGKITAHRLRDATTIGFSYDALGRVLTKDLPGAEPDVSYTYNLLGDPLSVSTSSQTVSATYDALGRQLTSSQPFGSMSYQYDVAGRRTRVTWWDGFYATYDYDVSGSLTAVRENGAASGIGVLATFTYDDLGRRTTVTRGNGVVSNYGFDNISRLTSLTHDLTGTGSDVTFGFSYNPSAQITSRTRSNDVYAWTGGVNTARAYTTNGLNQYTNAGGVSFGYDAKGNLTTSGTTTFAYTSENRLKSATGGIVLSYDPVGRLNQYDAATSVRFVYSGGQIAAEVANPAGTILRRYVPGGGVWYEGSGTTDRRWMLSDERGSVIAVTNASGGTIATNSYDEYGIPGSGNVGRFQYAGQIWLAELGMSYAKARVYSPSLGRFIQTDPTGYADGLNWYNYAGADPINYIDPQGTTKWYCTGSIIPHSSCDDSPSRLVCVGGGCTDPNAAGAAPGLTPDPQSDSTGGTTTAAGTGITFAPVPPGGKPNTFVDVDGTMYQAFIGPNGEKILQNVGNFFANSWNSLLNTWNPNTQTILEESASHLGVSASVLLTGSLGLEVGGAMLGESALSDGALVCRGGQCLAESFANGSGAWIDESGSLQGVSVNSGTGASLEDLTSTIPHRQVGVTTVGEIEALGGRVNPSPTDLNPFHCTLCGITPEQAEALFRPTVRNPSAL